MIARSVGHALAARRVGRVLCSTDGESIASALMQPTRIYVKNLLKLIAEQPVHALSHITGGGLLENLPRVLPEGCKAVIDTSSWDLPPVFKWLQKNGNVEATEMYRTFNCGVGMVVCVPQAAAPKSIELLSELGENAWVIGSIESKGDAEDAVVLRG